MTFQADVLGRLSEPGAALIEQVRDWGDVVVLGAGGKMGAGLCKMLAAAFASAGNSSRVIAVSRWRDNAARGVLAEAGVETVSADLGDVAMVRQLPEADRVVFLVGEKFGTSNVPYSAWMTNTVLPAAVATRYQDARIVVLSTGNVYPVVPLGSGGADESIQPAPLGEYAMSCLGRERVFQQAARERGTRVVIVRLNYACEPRYGVLSDIARRIVGGMPIDLDVGAVNVVDQRYVNEVILRCLDVAATPEAVLNLAGPETASVRWIAERLGAALQREPVFRGEEGDFSLLSNAARCHAKFGYPELSLLSLIEQQADWILAGGELWDKPTKFERTDGKY